MLIHRWDEPVDDDEWRAFIAAYEFGHLVAAGCDRDVAVVVPTQFVFLGDEVVLHLAKPNPVWSAIEENPSVLLSVAGDWAYIPSHWKAVGDEDRRRGIPTTYYAAVQLVGDATVIDDPDAVADVLRIQLGRYQPDVDVVDPLEHGPKLSAIRGIRIAVREVHTKMKFGGNVDAEHRAAIAEHLRTRGAPSDAAAEAHVERRSEDR
ncbi:MAG TPA: FMN-binding negative transcriptional regulator [Acidimicrobiales bacterium]|nr:FMN-binding negative transcriptional regulator [Acidimicrobiales bacterium]